MHSFVCVFIGEKMTGQTTGQNTNNPLQKYFRQPKLHVRLPSGGKYYPPGTLDLPESGEVAIYPLTAKDELLLKTPDSLMNGTATADVIKSCVPQIKNPWYMPSLDVDALIIAIRIATYGPEMTLTVKVPNTGDEKDFTVDLNNLVEPLMSAKYDAVIQLDKMKITLRPLMYSEFTKDAIRSFEEQRVYNLLNDDTVPAEEKMERFRAAFNRLTDLTVETVAKSIAQIEVDDQVVSEPKHILEFMQNTSKEFYTTILNHISEQRDKFAVKPFIANTTKEEQEKGAPETFEVPITFDQSNFFV
tara:strand:+ start:1410 stop:2315 length:906 start_codon:yes stop_codon:yes gene_type:complete